MKRLTFIALCLYSFALFSETRIRLASSNTQVERKATIRYLLDAFELENPGILVEIVDFEDNEALDSLVSKDISLLMGDSLLLYSLFQRNVIDHEFTGKIFENMEKKDFFTGCKNAFLGDNYVIGIPFSAWLQVIWFRQDWRRKYKLSPPDTLESLLEMASVFNQDPYKYGIVCGRADDTYIQQCFLHMAAAEDVSLKQSGSSYYFTAGELVPVLDYYTRLAETTPPGEVFWRYRDFYFQEKAGILIYSTHLIDDLVIPAIAADSLGSDNFKELAGKEYDEFLFKNTGMVTVLQGKEKASFGSVSGITFFSGMSDAQKQAAEKLVNFLYRTDVYISWLHMSPGGMLPVRKSILEKDEFFRDPGGVFRRFGREQIIKLSSGLEFLKIINPEQLEDDKTNGYETRDFQHLIYDYIQSPDMTLPDWIH